MEEQGRSEVKGVLTIQGWIRRIRCGRKGLDSQRGRREEEAELRRLVVETTFRLQSTGLTMKKISRDLHVPLRTLQEWRRRWRVDNLVPKPRGRPPERGTRKARERLLRTLKDLPPGTGLPTLRRENPDMPVGELRRMKKMHDEWTDKRRRLALSRCTWTEAGRAWSMDFAKPPFFLERGYTHFLLVRDLATKELLEVCPVRAEDGASVREALSFLFSYYGPPLIIKSDNGPAFLSGDTAEFLLQLGVLPLLSPPYTPRYNGSAERGVGDGKTYAGHHAAVLGRPGAWSVTDLAWARQTLNTVRVGTDGRTPAERAEGKTRVTVEERNAFLHLAETCLERARADRGKEPDKGFNKTQMASIYRQALRRALEKAGYLIVRRGSKQPVINPRFRAIISD